MVNWHLSDNVRLEFAYGYGSLDRFGLTAARSSSRPASSSRSREKEAANVLTSAVVSILLLQMPTGEPEKNQFQALETKVSSAVQAKDVAALDALLAKDFAFNLFLEGREPEVMNRAEWLKTSDLYTLSGFVIHNLAARVFGNVAIVRLQPYRTATAGTSAIDRSGEFAVVDVWTKDGDSWKLSARHLSRPDKLKR